MGIVWQKREKKERKRKHKDLERPAEGGKNEKGTRVARLGSVLEQDRDLKARKEPARADNNPEQPR